MIVAQWTSCDQVQRQCQTGQVGWLWLVRSYLTCILAWRACLESILISIIAVTLPASPAPGLDCLKAVLVLVLYLRTVALY